MMAAIISIGYSCFKITEIIDLLRSYRTEVLFDVRSTPYSKRFSYTNRENIEQELSSAGMKYVFIGDSFGGRSKDPNMYTDKVIDYTKVVSGEAYLQTKYKILKLLENGVSICLMCMEKDPIDCHRAIMIGRDFSKKGIIVHHIVEDGSTISQRDLDERVIKRYFPVESTYFFFGGKEKTLDIAYKKRNIEIGFNVGQRR